MEHYFKVDGKAKEERQTDEAANQTESIKRRRRDWGQFCVGSPPNTHQAELQGAAPRGIPGRNVLFGFNF